MNTPTMRYGAALKRQSDGKIFHVTLLSHWSDIQADDGETDEVKFYGPGYVSRVKGHAYTLQETDP